MSQGIVTPEAVVLEFQTADVGSRLVAAVIDLAVRGALFTVLALGSAVLGGIVHGGIAGVYLVLFLLLFGYPVAFESLWHGRTPGKAVLGLRVVTVEGSPEHFRHAAIRSVTGILDFYVTSGGAAVLAVLFSARNQRIGDMLAGTLVVRERTGASQPAAVNFAVPYGLELYTASLDVSGLTAADYGALRSFLLRAASLDAPRRYDLARQIATPLLVRLRHSPPPGIGPEVFLACVAAAYQARQRQAAHIGWTPPVGSAPPSGTPVVPVAVTSSGPLAQRASGLGPSEPAVGGFPPPD